MLAYPQTIVCLSNLQLPNKRSFANWFIQDYLLSQIMKKNQKLKEDTETKTNFAEISFEIHTDIAKINEVA